VHLHTLGELGQHREQLALVALGDARASTQRADHLLHGRCHAIHGEATVALRDHVHPELRAGGLDQQRQVAALLARFETAGAAHHFYRSSPCPVQHARMADQGFRSIRAELTTTVRKLARAIEHPLIFGRQLGVEWPKLAERHAPSFAPALGRPEFL